MSLQNTIESLASSFATKILAALREANLTELADIAGDEVGNGRAVKVTSVPKGKGGRLQRRSTDDLAEMVERIAGLLAKEVAGLRAEQIREALGVEKKELPRPIQEGLASGRFAKSGQKRATVYTLGKGKKGKK
ncbi:hypothetical protein AKJ09_01650 [Labilithrix luteola]|uniref:Uncharacterized protein n=1 Tax=Labilithrix luteola TaxID=1391654 RepID=A0A0K1PNL3_9BACT|nr:hypothetical protein [Labilithrix luteola]AKU94986.1 hypothetical protein AKJ09_01650 [Labilithrix luteola]